MYRASGQLVRAGEAYESARDFDAAIECYEEAGEISKQVDALDRRGDTFAAAEIALDNGWRARGIRLLRLVTPQSPHFADACILLADAFEREGHWDLAAQKLEEHINAVGSAGSSPDLQWRLAEMLENAGHVERALSLLEELRRSEPTYPNVASRIDLLRKKRSTVQVGAAASDGSRSASGDFAPPTMFLSDYRYEIIEEIGRGAMGVVFKGRDRRLSRIVALKRLPDSLRNYPRAVQLFLREAQATARLNHRNIVTVYDADQEDGAFFITMELLEGQPLHERVRELTRLPVEEVVDIGLQVSEGLDYAHGQGVIHRDIKTANLFLTRDGVAKITDFGLAKMLEEVRRAETRIGGTPFYMAPEQVAGGEVDPRADLYSLGATLFEMVTGRVPFADGDVTYHHRHTPPPDPRDLQPDVPDALAELILQMLAKSPDERPPSAHAVHVRLEALKRTLASDEGARSAPVAPPPAPPSG
jgi:tRNA A-37 threonylcarbamoyl transferase component Bud32